MHAIFRFSMALSICLAAQRTLERVYPNYSRELIPDICSLPRVTVEISEGLLEQRDLDGKSAATLHRIEEKRRLARAVMSGQMSLLQAAARYEQLNHDKAHVDISVYVHRFPSRTDGERLCLEVVAFATGEMESRWQARHIEERLMTEVSRLYDAGLLDRLPLLSEDTTARTHSAPSMNSKQLPTL